MQTEFRSAWNAPARQAFAASQQSQMPKMLALSIMALSQPFRGE
jgi:hypothetical protein